MKAAKRPYEKPAIFRRELLPLVAADKSAPT
jgi:hypothetical protein